MKFKNLHIALLALLVSCEAAQVDLVNKPSAEVGFFVSQGDEPTKGRPINSAKKLSDIGVFATLTHRPYAEVGPLAPDFMSNQLVERVGGEWRYSPVRKWSSEPDDLVSFFAYAPYANDDNGLSILPVGGNVPMIRYRVPRRDTQKHPDLMVAQPLYDRVGSQGVVGLTFRHALAAISFSVKGDPTRLITDVKLSNVVPAATLSLADSVIAWSDHDELESRSYDLGLIGGVVAPEGGDAAASITASDGYLMMIPQAIEDVEIEVQVNGEDDLIYLNFEPGSEWVAGAKYNYVIDLEADTLFSHGVSQTSNCYIVDSRTVKDLYIPIDQRINAFWHSYSGLDESESAKYMIDDTTVWRAKILWCDTTSLSAASVEPYVGVVPPDCSTSKSYVCDDTKAVMKVSLPANSVSGNILVIVTKEVDGVESTLWSWHLWVTDYNPDSQITPTSKPIRFKVENGELHRYVKNDTVYWANGIYANSFAMDRDIGSHDEKSIGALFYQWGRKDPFSTAIGWSVVKKYATFATAVQNPTAFYSFKRSGVTKWCDEPQELANNVDAYLWYDRTKLNPLTHAGLTRIEKSIFDPSPLGWCVPLSVAYANWGTRHSYNDIVYFDMSGDIIPTSCDLHEYEKTTSLWCSDRTPEGKAYFPYITKDEFSVFGISTAYGHRIRPVKIPN